MIQRADHTVITRADRVEAGEDLTRLFSELAGHEAVPDVGRINALIEAGTLAFYVAGDRDRIIAMASVIACRTAVSDKLWIEDVCVLGEYRGQGIGRRLMEYVMTDAVACFGPGTFWLTSRPSRLAARQMYRSLGFTEHETGVFRMDADNFNGRSPH